MPFGVAALHEPDPGLDVDWLILGVGWASVPVVLAASASFVGVIARHRRRPSAVGPRFGAISKARLPVAVDLGIRYALGPHHRRRDAPLRSTLVAAAIGILGVVAAFTFAAGVADARAHPERFGQRYQLQVIFGFDGQDFVPAPAVLASLSANQAVDGVTNLRVAGGSSGPTSFATHTFDPVGTPVPLVLTDGVAPRAPGDIVLASTTAKRLHAAVGSTVPLRGNVTEMSMTVSGIGFAVESSTSGYDQGAWIMPADYDRLFSGFKEHAALVALRPAVPPSVVLARLRADVARAGAPNVLIIPPFVPAQVAEIGDLRHLPVLLGLFLALLGVGATAHSLAVGVRRRNRDVAVMRALGASEWQCRGLVLTQVVIVAVVGVVVGLPLGLALGRALWRATAASTPLAYRAPLAPWALLLVAPAAVAIGVVLAAWPAHRAATAPLVPALRAE
jgi:hypothetical protein